MSGTTSNSGPGTSGPEGAADRLRAVRSEIDAAAASAGRAPDSVNLIAVSKTFDPGDIRPVLEAGQRHFGENRVQEALAKWPDLRQDREDVHLHLIGPLQTNKVREAVSLFDSIHTLDRSRLATALAREFARTGRAVDVFVQVNTGAEPQKSGVRAEDADGLVSEARVLGIPVVGLMCLPPADEPPGPHFALLAKIAERNGLARLSMGMSHDFQTAIRFGATDVRIGTAIFGVRDRAG